jgi:hypothetical protein
VAFDSILALSSAVGETVALAFLLRRGVGRILPVFCAYLAWTIVSDLTGLYFLFHPSFSSYIFFYKIEMIVDALLQFTVLVELGWSVLRPVRASLPRGTIFVLAGLVALAGILIWPLAGMTTPSYLKGQGITIFHLAQTFTILRIVCFLVMASFSQLLSIGWRDRELQIATGFGFYSIVSLIATLLYSHQSSSQGLHMVARAVPISYLGTLSYWVFSFATKEQERKEFSPQMQQLLVLMGGGARSGSIALTDLPSKRSRKKD